MEAFDYLKNYYESHDENVRLNNKRGNVEFLTTLRYIEKYLKKDDRILEIGAGAGHYSHHFARNGYLVDAVELIPHNIEIFKKNTEKNERVSIHEGNATDLSMYPDNTFDITLSLGPMYHLFIKDDQKRALSEAVRVTKPNGLIFVAYCMNEPSIIQAGFMRNLIHEEPFASIEKETFHCFAAPEWIFTLYRTEDIFALTENLPSERLHLVGTDLFTRYMAQTVDQMDENTYGLYLKYHYSICERSDLIGISNHVLDILKKKA